MKARRFWFCCTLTMFLLIGCNMGAADPTGTPRPASEDPTPTATTLPPPTEAPTATPMLAATPTDEAAMTLDAYIAELPGALTAGPDAIQSLLAEPFAYGLWRSEWVTATPATGADQIATWAPAGTGYETLGNEPADFMDGVNPYDMLGPDVVVRAVVRGRDWGGNGLGEALLFIVEAADGGFSVSATLYAPEGFQPAGAIGLTGLLFHNQFGLFQMGQDGQPHLITDREAFPSPDLSRALLLSNFGVERELVILDLSSGSESVVPFDDDLVGCYLWLDSSRLACGVRLADEEEGPNLGHLAIVDVDSGEVTLPTPERWLFSPPAVDAAGTTLAFNGGDGTAFLWENGTVTAFAWRGQAGLPEPIGLGIGSPAFAPDGSSLTWLVGAQPMHLILFDLDANVIDTLYSFDPIGFGGFFPTPVWSPDGTWLALIVLAANPEDGGLWLIAADGSEARQLESRAPATPVWLGPNQLVYSVTDNSFNTTTWLYSPATDSFTELSLPEGSVVAALPR